MQVPGWVRGTDIEWSNGTLFQRRMVKRSRVWKG